MLSFGSTLSKRYELNNVLIIVVVLFSGVELYCTIQSLLCLTFWLDVQI